MPLKKCIKATANLNNDDVSSVLDAYDSYIETMDEKSAAQHAIDDAIISVESERKEYVDLFNETYPDTLKESGQNNDLSEKPVVKDKANPNKKVDMPFKPQPISSKEDTPNKDPLLSKTPEGFNQYSEQEKTKPKKSISVEHLNRLVKIMQRESPGTRFINFHIRDTQSQAFGEDSIKEHGIIKGGFYSGSDEVVLIAENIKDVNDAITVIRHEVVGHYGLRQLLNKEGKYDKLLKRVYDSRDGELKELYDWVAKAYPDLVNKNDIRSIADEMLARASETKTESSLIKEFYDFIIKMLNKLGLVMDSISQKEVESLIRSSSKNLRKGTLAARRSYSPTVAYSIEGVDGRSFDIEQGGTLTRGPNNNNLNQEINDTPTDGNLGMPDETTTDKFVRLAQDSFNRIKKLQKTIVEQGGTVDPVSDVYRAEERSSGKITKKLNDIEKKSLTPMLSLMREKDITIDILDSYLLAKHAGERNRYIAEINDDMPDGGSGITNQQATDILSELSEKTNDLEEIAKFVYTVNNQSLDNLVSGGHMKQQEVDDLKSQWEFYVPLKGKEGIDYRQGTGSGFSISGTGLKSAMGRGEGNISESPTAHSFAQAESIVVRTEKTKIGQALIELVRANPDPNFWTISNRTYQKFTDLFGEPFEGYTEVPEGLIEGIDYHRTFVITKNERILAKEEDRKPKKKVVYALDPNYKRRDDIFSVMIEGEELLVNIKDSIVMEQLKKMNSTQLNAVFAGIGTINRYLAMVNTALNPEFVITNFERDFQTAMVNLGGEQSVKTAAKVAKAIPGAIRGIWQSTFDTKGKSEWREIYDEMQSEGGTVGFFGLEDIDTKVKNMRRKLSNNHGVLGRSKQGIFAVRDMILDANLSVENASRLAAYKIVRDESISNGMSKADAKSRAASIAKNLTVNFNRKGELAPVLNSAYLFYNASIQGSFRMFTALKSNRVKKIVGGIAAASFMLAMYNRSVGGDDDDGTPYWDKISDYVKQTNLIFMVPDGSGEYYKIKLPYGYNVFSYTGTALHDLAYSESKNVINTAASLASTAMNAFNPIQGADLLDTVIPTFFKPAEQNVRNINFMGSPIKPEFKFDNYDRPESQKAFKSTNPMLKDFMSALNETTGGNETHSGLIDVSPEIIKHYTNWVTGGAGMFVARTLGTARNLITGEEVESKNTPFLRTVKGNTGSFYDTERFYKAISGVNAVEAQIKLYKGTDKWREYKSENKEVHKLAIHVRKYKNKIKRLREQRDKAYLQEDRDLALEKSEEIRQQMMRFSTLYDDAIEAQE